MENVLPYVTLGIGYANVGVNYSEPGYELDKNNSAFAYQLGAGIGIPVSDNVTIDIGYRYFATTDIEIQPGIELNIGSHNILAGFRHTF
ncbi:outer membrane protein [Pelodictyon luteolum]|uniref:outer membrane protein n=1 Tax=Pelodictyon luteolum TaxID=1100 RepID=UPI0002E6E607|nr:outer membrane beta-barrel protein [Pelodictyon luteolum]